jgi:hypothetical protein
MKPSQEQFPQTSSSKKASNDNPKWKCESCGKKGAQDYAGQGRVCESCANERGF